MAMRDRRQQIMRAAERLFTSRRFHEITLDDVAEEARVGKGTIYRHFRDKEDLFFQVALSGFDELCDLLRRKVCDGEPFEGQLLSACRSVSRFFESRRQLLRIMQTEDARMHWCRGPMHEEWGARRRNLAAAMGQVLEKGVRESKVRPDVPAEALAQFLLGMLRTRARDLEEAPETVKSHEIVVELFLRGAGSGTRGPDSAADAVERRRGADSGAPGSL